MKRFELSFNIASVPVDAIMLLAAGSSAYFLRYRVNIAQYPVLFDLSYREFIRNTAIALPFLLVILAFFGLYNIKATEKYFKTFGKIIAGISTGLMVFIAFYFFNPQIFPSRLIALMSWILAIFFICLGRFLMLRFQKYFLKRGYGLHKLVVVADPAQNSNLLDEIRTKPELGYNLIGTFSFGDHTIEDLEKLRKEKGLDEIIIASPGLDKGALAGLLKFTHDWGIKFNYIPDIIEAQRINIETAEINGMPIIELKNTPLEGWGRVVKRVIDILLSVLGIAVASPLYVLVAMGIIIDSPGKIFFVQERFGQGKPFKFYKFRSMYQDLSVGDEYGGEKALKVREDLKKANARPGPFVKIKHDPRVTRFGRFIRKTKLDELPQLFNVLIGNMSLVGPRAHVLDEVDAYKNTYKRQFTIKPGVTGLTQITQVRIPNLPFEEEIRLDTWYLENWSLKLDFSILFRTFLILIKRPKTDIDY